MSCTRCGRCCRAVYFRPFHLHDRLCELRDCILYDHKYVHGMEYYVGFCIHYEPGHGCLIYENRPAICVDFLCASPMYDIDEYAPKTVAEAMRRSVPGPPCSTAIQEFFDKDACR